MIISNYKYINLYLLQVRQTIFFDIALVLHFQFMPVVIAVGIPGNILTLIVMLQRKNRHTTCCIYMAYLAISDTLILLYGAFTWFDARYQLIPKTDLSCGIANLFLGVVSNFNVMLLVALSLDRFLAIKFPLKAPVLCSVRRANISLVSIAVVAVVFTLPILFTAKSPDGRICAAHASGTLLDQIHAVVSLLLFSIVPFCFLLFMNIAILIVIRRSHITMDKYRDDTAPDPTKLETADKVKSKRKVSILLVRIC